MLASITPLGERSRQARWGVTFAWFVVAAVAAGAASGLAAGGLGALLLGGVDTGARLLVLAGAGGLALVLDLRVAGLRTPTIRRQVNANWLDRYRGWVYGAGFGAQLGLGLATVVTSAATYVAFMAAFLTASPLAGAAILGAYGLVRGLSLLPARSVRTPAGALALTSRLARAGRASVVWGHIGVATTTAALAGAVLI